VAGKLFEKSLGSKIFPEGHDLMQIGLSRIIFVQKEKYITIKILGGAVQLENWGTVQTSQSTSGSSWSYWGSSWRRDRISSNRL
jgi:hypothetical protein